MCGIIGYTGDDIALPILLDGLETLEYRGYDSAGISVYEKSGVKTVKSKGRLSDLREKTRDMDLCATSGIGHTRWATHGAPSDTNAHPHTTEHLSLVHNGIIENESEIGIFLSERGYAFVSDTDTEKAAKLLDYCYLEEKDPKKAMFRAAKLLRGSYAFGVIFYDFPGKVFCMRKDSPLIAAATEAGAFIASDVPAILKHTRTYYRLPEHVIGLLNGEEKTVQFFAESGEEVSLETETALWNVEEAKKGGYPFFMLKEIHEEPEAIRKTVAPRLQNLLPYFSIPTLDSNESLKGISAIHIVACGTAMHAGLIGKEYIERFARIPVDVQIASEFRYGDPILRQNDLVILLSQSGETSDTLAALRHAKRAGIRTLAIVNVIGSSVAREADEVLYTWAGPEIAVASTKAYSVQASLLLLLAIRLALCEGKITEERGRELAKGLLETVPKTVEAVLRESETIRDFAKTLTDEEHVFYIGRNMDCALCTEASLKLKEISYIHSEAYASGELKHGTISLITDGVPVIALMTVSSVAEKTISGIREVISRGGRVFTFASKAIADAYEIPGEACFVLPEIPEDLAMFPAITSLQLLAYHVSAEKGLDVDKPRNLAKSVTVE